MKPVKNRIRACFEIGKLYKYKSEDYVFEVMSMMICNDPICCKHTHLCDHTRARDQNGGIWCGVYLDFEGEEE